IGALSLDSSVEMHALFSQRNLLRLAALADSQRTLSLFTPSIADAAFRACAAITCPPPSEHAPAITMPLARTASHSHSHSHSRVGSEAGSLGSASVRSSLSGTGNGNGNAWSAYGLSVGAGRRPGYGYGYGNGYGLHGSAGSQGKNKKKTKKRRVVDLRTKAAPDTVPEEAAVASEDEKKAMKAKIEDRELKTPMTEEGRRGASPANAPPVAPKRTATATVTATAGADADADADAHAQRHRQQWVASTHAQTQSTLRSRHASHRESASSPTSPPPPRGSSAIPGI
ncbi:ERMES complex subunit, partial [Ascosphaera acerosa]